MTLTVATFVVALVGTYFAWQNHRARVRSELPDIRAVPTGNGHYVQRQIMLIRFEFGPHKCGNGWRVVKVGVIEASPRKCLRHEKTGQREWEDFHVFDYPIEPGQSTELDVRPGCNEILLRFLCERPRKRWWKKGLIQERKWVGPITTSWLLQVK